jgi:crotonobetainyl-CoA:carnitine CoA-transferase CaiB-like acyl-CoA transferase
MATVVESETASDALPLSDPRVVECGEGVAAAFATKLMAMLGAEVVKVERPAGDVTRERGPFFDDLSSAKIR